VSAMVAAFFDQLLGRGQIRFWRFPRIWLCCFIPHAAFLLFTPHSPLRTPHSEQSGSVQVNIRQEQSHRAALGDFPGFVQVALRALGTDARAGETPQPGAGEKSAREVVLPTSSAEAGHGGDRKSTRLNSSHANISYAVF